MPQYGRAMAQRPVIVRLSAIVTIMMSALLGPQFVPSRKFLSRSREPGARNFYLSTAQQLLRDSKPQ